MALMARPSITPEDAGCQQALATRLADAGFEIEQIDRGEVRNMWATHGDGAPLLCLLGHTDVVPPGPERHWSSPPFEPTLRDGMLYGRGAADMKGSVAAMVTAAERFLRREPEHRGRLAIMLTSDEEGPAEHGVKHLMRVLDERGERIDWCLIGEPTCEERFGDTIKNGRRGSLNGYLQVRGLQGHLAYPHKADNPITKTLPALQALAATEWDRGNEHFPPTCLQFSALVSDGGADNIIPGELRLNFNFRYSSENSMDSLRKRTEEILKAHELDYKLDWHDGGQPFVTEPGELSEALAAAIAERTGEQAQLSTAGGTSDGRFVAPGGAQVVEFGPLNSTAHKVDEAVDPAVLDDLSRIYERVIERLLAP